RLIFLLLLVSTSPAPLGMLAVHGRPGDRSLSGASAKSPTVGRTHGGSRTSQAASAQRKALAGCTTKALAYIQPTVCPPQDPYLPGASSRPKRGGSAQAWAIRSGTTNCSGGYCAAAGSRWASSRRPKAM